MACSLGMNPFCSLWDLKFLFFVATSRRTVDFHARFENAALPRQTWVVSGKMALFHTKSRPTLQVFYWFIRKKYVFVLQVNKKIKACLSTLSMIFMYKHSIHSHSQYDLYQVPHTCLYIETFLSSLKWVNMINSKFCKYQCITFLCWCACFYMHSFVYVQNVSPTKSHLCVCHASLGKLHVHHLRGKNNRTRLYSIYTKTMRVR